MHAAIAEQAEELEKLEQGCDEVEHRLQGLETQEQECREKCERSRGECEALRTRLEEGRCFSKAEVFRLQGELHCGRCLSSRDADYRSRS